MEGLYKKMISEIYNHLGGNKNNADAAIACAKIALKYKDEVVKKMNYIHCSTLLKDKEVISFEYWKKRHLIDVNRFNNTFLHDTEGWIEEHKLIDKYNSEVMNL